LDQKQLILAALLSLLVLLGWSFLFPARPPAQEVSPPIATPSAAAANGTAAGAAQAGIAPGTPAGTPETAQPAIWAAAEERVEVETSLGHAVFTNRGAQLLSYRVKDVKGRDGQPLEMVRARAEGPYPFALSDANGAALALDDALFVVEGPLDDAKDRSRVVNFRHTSAAGSATKSFRFLGNGLIEVAIEVEDVDGWGVFMGPGLRNPTIDELKKKDLFRGASYLIGNELETHPAQKLREEVRVPGTGVHWSAIEDTYFLSMMAPKTPIVAITLQPLLVVAGVDGAPPQFLPRPPPDQLTKEQEDLPQEVRLVLTPQGERLEADAYWGAKRYETLVKLLDNRYQLTQTIRWGMFGILAKPMLSLLLWIHDHVVANFGWAIVVLTVIIKLALMPLTHKSYVSMQKMQKLSPKIEAIKQKYRGKQRDKSGRPNLESQRKMNEEMQELFKTEGVNPAGGCLPMLLQMPVFFAFFGLLRNSVELWNAPWIMWIHDLSAKDPYFVLPIVMGAAQFLQQRMTPTTTANPGQKMLLNTMPIWFTVISFGFASGLVLYWLTNNVMTILQQAIYQRLKKAGYLGGPDTLAPASAPVVRKERAARVKKR
jgi:YidC/Oxa1 family membrane protein insertase